MDSISNAQFSEPAVNISNAAPSLLRTLFLHHDGIIVGATVAALNHHGVLETLFRDKRLSMKTLLKAHPCNSGYLHVALRCLALQGWIKRQGSMASEDMVFEVTPIGDLVSKYFELYTEIAEFIYSGIPLEESLFGIEELESAYPQLVTKCLSNWDLPYKNEKSEHTAIHEIVTQHLNGLLAGPTMIALKNYGLLNERQLSSESLSSMNKNLHSALVLLEHLKWLNPSENRWEFSDLGMLACEFSLHYGLTLSYWPMLCNLQNLIFNAARNVTHVQRGEEEEHVDRILNVLASGVAHRRYFEDSDKIIIEIFNQEPMSRQPKFVADMGCGDGAWLKRVYQVIKTETRRGLNLDRYPLLMVGADYNIKAQDVAHHQLTEANVPHIVLFGDITDPKQFADELKTHKIDIHEGLHIRAFIDHNRRYTHPLDRDSANQRTSLSSGAYADDNGNPIRNDYLEQNLVEHFRKWVPFLHKHGLIVIEAHNVDPRIASEYNGKTHATAFDTYHGYSNQYPLDFEAFMQLAEEAGLRAISYQQSLYPSRLPFVAISINRFKASKTRSIHENSKPSQKKPDEWQPTGNEDLNDGEALHQFLYENGDITRPKRWCFRATGMLVEAILKEIDERIQCIRTGQNTRKSITLMDYGAGTGLATLELIKGLEEKGLLKQIEEHNISFSLLLFDFPSGWFAKGYQLLRRFPFVRFYSLQHPKTHEIQLIEKILGHKKVDVIVASMVLHLVPPKVLPLLSDSFDAALNDDGILLWNTPDTTPTTTNAEVIHATNRELRKTFLACLDSEKKFLAILSKVPKNQRMVYTDLPIHLQEIKKNLTPILAAEAQIRANRQILPDPTDLKYIEQALDKHFIGSHSTLISLLREKDLLDLALLPANQRYINEVENVNCRKRLITLLLNYEVIPKFCEGPTGHPNGLNLHWIYGRYCKKRG